MPDVAVLRRRILTLLAALPLMRLGRAQAAPRAVAITRFGALPDGVTINTRAIQATIDHVAGAGGGTVIVPAGVFVSGALFLKPGVHLHLAARAVLRCAVDPVHFPPQRTRIEGHFEDRFTPALINAAGCDGLRITGTGTLDGDGRPIWDGFWALRAASPDPANFPNLGLPRARLALIERSRDVLVEGVTFKDSQFWNLHLYRCDGATVRNARFVVPDDYAKAPSTDGIDIDSSRHVTVEGCYFSVTDDCIAAKGSKGPFALADRDSPPVEHIRIRNCHFRRGHNALACGSEATIVRDVRMEGCRVTGKIVLLRLKLRPDTPQTYEDIAVTDITLDDAAGTVLAIEPWSQYRDLRGAAPPRSVVRRVTLSRIRGRFGTLGMVRGNPGQTVIGQVAMRDIDVRLTTPPDRSALAGVTLARVVVNGEPIR